MGKRLFYIITFVFIGLIATLPAHAQQQPSIYKVVKMSFYEINVIFGGVDFGGGQVFFRVVLSSLLCLLTMLLLLTL